MTTKKHESLLKFPCDFTIKVFGKATDEFEATVLGIIRKHIPSATEPKLQANTSENGKYKALTVAIHVETRAQLDSIYQELSSSPQVLMAL